MRPTVLGAAAAVVVASASAAAALELYDAEFGGNGFCAMQVGLDAPQYMYFSDCPNGCLILRYPSAGGGLECRAAGCAYWTIDVSRSSANIQYYKAELEFTAAMLENTDLEDALARIDARNLPKVEGYVCDSTMMGQPGVGDGGVYGEDCNLFTDASSSCGQLPQYGQLGTDVVTSGYTPPTAAPPTPTAPTAPAAFPTYSRTYPPVASPYTCTSCVLASSRATYIALAVVAGVEVIVGTALVYVWCKKNEYRRVMAEARAPRLCGVGLGGRGMGRRADNGLLRGRLGDARLLGPGRAAGTRRRAQARDARGRAGRERAKRAVLFAVAGCWSCWRCGYRGRQPWCRRARGCCAGRGGESGSGPRGVTVA